MRALYDHTNQFMVRLPLQNNSLDFLNNEDQDRLLTQLCEDPAFREQVLVSSKTLYETMKHFLNRPEKLTGKKKRNFVESMIKYAIRKAIRTTPFGLFTSVGAGQFASGEQFTFDQHQFYKKARVDLEWLFNMIKKLEKESADRLEFRMNDACYVKGDRAFLLYSTDGKADEISIRATPVFRIVYESCGEFVSFQDITRRLSQKYPHTEGGRIKDYVMELIDKEFLLSNLRPPLTVLDQYQYFIEQAGKVSVAEDRLAELKAIAVQMEHYSQLPLGQGEHEYIALFEKMNQLEKSSSPLQLDSGLGKSSFTLSEQTAAEICKLASILTMLARPFAKQSGYLEHYKNQFMEKYGMDREVAIMEMLDSSSGIGAPLSYANPYNDFHEVLPMDEEDSSGLKNYFLNKYVDALREHGAIELNDAELTPYCDSAIDPNEIPVSLELNFLIKSYDQQLMLYMGPNTGSTAAGKTFGRFSYLSKEMASIVQALNDKEKEIRNENFSLCELSYIPNQVRAGNVTRNLSYRAKEMSLFTNSSRSEQDRVKIEDILIGIDENMFYARHRATKELLVFESNNMLNPLSASNAIRFLQEIALDGKRNWSLLPWLEVYKGFKYIPEIRYKSIVLSSAQWSISLDDLHGTPKMDFKEFKSRFIQYHTHNGLPEKFYIVRGDNRLLIAVNHDELLKILYAEMKKSTHTPLNLVAIEQGEDVAIDEQQHLHAAEVVVPLFKRQFEDQQHKLRVRMSGCTQEDSRVKMPFDDWLFLKLYAQSSREEELIAFEIADFCGSLSEKYPIQYFFMRYKDPKSHVRLRFHGDSSMLLEIYPAILNWLKGLKQRGLVADTVLSSYDRELERYGGSELMEAAEQVFFVDSKIVEQILRMTRMKQLTMSKEIIGVISIMNYMNQLSLDFEAQLDFMENNSSPAQYRTEFREDKDNLLALCNGDPHWMEVRKTEAGNVLIHLLEQRNETVANYAQLLKEQADRLTTPEEHIWGSIIHLHCNRLLGTDRELENKVMTLTRHILYSRRYQQTKEPLLWK